MPFGRLNFLVIYSLDLQSPGVAQQNLGTIHRMGSPYSSHPIYALRKWTIISSVVGLIVNSLVFAEPLSLFLVLSSAIFCLADFIDWANKKVTDPDHEPKWPRKLFMVLDIIFALLLLLAFWYAICISVFGYYYRGPVEAYAALFYLTSSFLHAYSFWKELMGQKKAAWLAKLQAPACERCGWLNQADSVERHCQPQHPSPPNATKAQPSRPATRQNVQPNLFTYAGPSASESATSYQRGDDILTPQHTESAMEEGLLIGSDVGTGYGSIAESVAADTHLEPELDQPAEIVVGKGKGSKKKGKGKAQENKE
ncbi:hypothetical protein K431DRAFT_286453 [Polychaeton citri CBS 116435]|uniref:Uncharacterized protein n=1 Tax=Polychaeton citri CBS 116435 TaxID=1314669 RepID=A0A9P4Q525_9PEZI|nr:hypothetical protein K431DRAFT_286453 [Polychaeton citri CBS 116435]